MTDRDKDAEILALRHQLTVLHRQLGTERVRFHPADRAVLAALLHRLPPFVLRQVLLLVRPDTALRWHRDLLARRARSLCTPHATIFVAVASLLTVVAQWQSGRRRSALATGRKRSLLSVEFLGLETTRHIPGTTSRQ